MPTDPSKPAPIDPENADALVADYERLRAELTAFSETIAQRKIQVRRNLRKTADDYLRARVDRGDLALIRSRLGLTPEGVSDDALYEIGARLFEIAKLAPPSPADVLHGLVELFGDEKPEPSGRTSSGELSPLLQSVLDALPEGSEVELADIVTRMGEGGIEVSTGSIRQALLKLVDRKLVSRPRHGFYCRTVGTP